MSVFYWYLRTVVQSYPSAWLRLALMWLALMMGCLGVSAVLVINQGARQSYAEHGQGVLPQIGFKLVASSSGAISKQDYAKVRRQGVTEAVALSKMSTVLFAPKNQPITQDPVQITGFDSLAVLNYLASQPVEGESSPGQASRSPLRLELANFAQNKALVHPTLYAQLHTQPQTEITTVLGQRLPELHKVNLATVGNEIFMDMTLFAQTFGPTPISDVLLMGDISPQRLAEIRELLPVHLRVLSLLTPEQSAGMTESFHLNLLAMALLMFVVCLFIVMNACQLLLMQRLPMLKIFRQLGISRLTILAGQLFELWLITLLAAAVGVYLGVALALYLAPGIQATLESLFRVSVGFGEVSYLSLYVQVLGLGTVGIALAALLPVKKLNQALFRAVDYAPPGSNWFMRLAGLALGAAILTLWLSQTMLMSLLSIALLILAGCFTLIASYPYILNTASALLPKRWPLLHWSLQHSLWLSGRSKVACCAFFIALMSNIGMNLMVDSFRQATYAWLDQRLIADYYLYQDDEQDVPASIARLQLDIQVVQRFELKLQYADLLTQVHSYPSSKRFLAALKTQTRLPQAETLYTSGQGAYVNQQFALRHQIELGQTLAVPLDSRIKSFQVVGITFDYGNPYGQILLPPQTFSNHSQRSNLLALFGSQEQIDTLSQSLTQQGFIPSQQLYSAERLLSLSMATFERTFIITDGLNIITLLVAAASLACGIIVLLQDTQPQLTLLRTMGVSRRMMQGLSLLQYLFLCVLALGFAIPFGILLSWLLINRVNKQAFYWTYPLDISVSQIATVSALGLLLVSMIILLPLLSANNRPLIKDIRWLN